jgi:hypothetical protein
MFTRSLYRTLATAAALVLLMAACEPSALSADPLTLVAFDSQFDTAALALEDATARGAGQGPSGVLEIATGHAAPWPGVTIRAPADHWELSSFAGVAVAVRNTGSQDVTVHLRVDSPGGDGTKHSVTGHVTVRPGGTERLVVPLRRQLPESLAAKLFGMRGFPGGYVKDGGLDVSRITQLIVFVNRPQADHTFQIGTIQAVGTHAVERWVSMTADEFFPMIDRFGQFLHKDWPGKIESEEDLQRARDLEMTDLERNPSPAEWDKFGGWAAGPQLTATGYFYAAKHEGKWWLVDPEGRLFWSHGVDCVGFSQGVTPITDREFYFAELPAADSPLAGFYGTGSWAPHNYYEDKGEYRTFNFQAANLLRKYGSGWYDQAAETCHRRLRSWSLNTIANWSDSRIYLARKTPYVVAAGSSGAKPIAGSTGYWGKFPDPFDPSFRAAIQRRMEHERDRSAGDPWCIGYFVDNELGWGDDVSLARATLASPPDQAAKRVFLEQLQQTYANIAALNAAWGTTHGSWEALLESRTPPEDERARTDLESFYTRIAEEYFRVARDVVKHVAPQNLYLGCRFAWVNDRGARAGAQYCDVIGYNLYQDDVREFRLPEGVDKPVMIGEFHFGALDRGMFHTGLRATASQDARAAAYRNYVTGALCHPSFVGTHWFQYGDQATTGRGDGENYQIGLVDICDTPYPETIAAVREVGRNLYATRRNAP